MDKFISVGAGPRRNENVVYFDVYMLKFSILADDSEISSLVILTLPLKSHYFATTFCFCGDDTALTDRSQQQQPPWWRRLLQAETYIHNRQHESRQVSGRQEEQQDDDGSLFISVGSTTCVVPKITWYMHTVHCFVVIHVNFFWRCLVRERSSSSSTSLS